MALASQADLVSPSWLVTLCPVYSGLQFLVSPPRRLCGGMGAGRIPSQGWC